MNEAIQNGAQHSDTAVSVNGLDKTGSKSAILKEHPASQSFCCNGVVCRS
jgi:hypothetical protein